MRHISRSVLASIGLLATALSICAICIYRQGQLREIHSSDGIAVISPGEPDEPLNSAAQARLDRAIELYKNNYGRTILLPGDPQQSPDDQPGYAYLLRHGIDQTAIGLYPAETTLVGHLRGLGAISGARSLRSVLLVSDPPQLLRVMKIAQDQGIPAYAMPVQANQPAGAWTQLSTLWDESWRYLGYLLFNQ